MSSGYGWAGPAASSTSSTRAARRCRRTFPDFRRTGETALVFPGHTRRRLTVRIPVTLVAVLALLFGPSATSGPAAASQTYPVSYHSFALSAGTGTGGKSGALTLGSSGLTTTRYT